MSNITVINPIRNQFEGIVQFVNTETNSNNRTVLPNGVASPGAWVPWCDNPEEFPAHHLQVSAQGHVCYIYQSGPYVWSSRVGFGIAADILGPQGSEYALVIGPDFSVTVSSGTAEADSNTGNPLSSQ